MTAPNYAAAGIKPRYELLDGLRGVAAFAVIWYHFFEGRQVYAPTGDPAAADGGAQCGAWASCLPSSGQCAVGRLCRACWHGSVVAAYGAFSDSRFSGDGGRCAWQRRDVSSERSELVAVF